MKHVDFVVRTYRDGEYVGTVISKLNDDAVVVSVRKPDGKPEIVHLSSAASGPTTAQVIEVMSREVRNLCGDGQYQTSLTVECGKRTETIPPASLPAFVRRCYEAAKAASSASSKAPRSRRARAGSSGAGLAPRRSQGAPRRA